jgi:vitellogenic carboxypeptidase-like protein
LPPEVKANINAPVGLVYEACSKEVDAIMGHDVMKSVANLVPDLLARSHVLLYHGQFDAECGVASNEAWISILQW